MSTRSSFKRSMNPISDSVSAKQYVNAKSYISERSRKLAICTEIPYKDSSWSRNRSIAHSNSEVPQRGSGSSRRRWDEAACAEPLKDLRIGRSKPLYCDE